MTYQPEIWWNWIYDKTRISQITGISPDALHVHFSMAILFGAALLFRKPPWNWRPWLVVLVLETANEAYDMLQTMYSTDEGNLRASWHDMWQTMLWPTALLIAVPLLRRWWDRPKPVPVESEDERAGERADVSTDIVA